MKPTICIGVDSTGTEIVIEMTTHLNGTAVVIDYCLDAEGAGAIVRDLTDAIAAMRSPEALKRFIDSSVRAETPVGARVTKTQAN